MLRRLYDWTMSLARTRHAEKGLAAVSFIESSVFPIPPDVLLIPMVLADRQKWLRYALICTGASVIGSSSDGSDDASCSTSSIIEPYRSSRCRTR